LKRIETKEGKKWERERRGGRKSACWRERGRVKESLLEKERDREGGGRKSVC